MATKKERERAEAREDLLKLVHMGDTIYTIIRSVSRSGMSRNIDLYIMQDNEPRWISTLVARALGWSMAKRGEGIKVEGCGMDMCFAAVYALGRTLFPEGGPIDKSTNHTRGRAVVHEPDGGYLLNRRDL